MTPDKTGFWFHIPSQELIEVYPLEPAGGVLCLWGPDIGHGYTGALDTQGCWISDEWQGHIPINRFDDNDDNWKDMNEV